MQVFTRDKWTCDYINKISVCNILAFKVVFGTFSFLCSYSLFHIIAVASVGTRIILYIIDTVWNEEIDDRP
jgi:hypothetical protein